MVTIKQQIYEVLIEVGTLTWQSSSDENAKNDIEAVVERAKHRPLTEVTDQLWTVLRRNKMQFFLSIRSACGPNFSICIKS